MLRSIVLGLAVAMLIVLGSVLTRSNNLLQDLFTQQVVSYRNAVAVAAPAVVNVYNQSLQEVGNLGRNDLTINNLGSGVIMRKDGYILTNKHVIRNADQIVVARQTGEIYEAILVGSDSLTDLAVLKIKADNLPTIPQNAKRKVHVGDVVLAIGNPYNLGQSVSQGIVSATSRNAVSEMGYQNFIQTDASINQGNSGGALINTVGELIGINTLSIGKNSSEIAEGLSFAIPIDLANRVLTKIIRDGRVIRGYLGIQSKIFYNNFADEILQKGILVTGLDESGPAIKAGIQVGDVILKVGDITPSSPSQLLSIIPDTKPGTIVKIQVVRDGKIFEFPVKVEEYPSLD